MLRNKVKCKATFIQRKRNTVKSNKFLLRKIKKMKMDQTILLEQVQKNVKANETTKEELKLEKKKVENLKKHVECTICLEVPRRGPMAACSNGHLLCPKCKQESCYCPTCGTSMGDNKSLLAAVVIENVLHDCKFVECEQELPLEKIEEHEKGCKHRIVCCPYYTTSPFTRCGKMVPLSKLLDHLCEESNTCSRVKKPILVGGSLVTLGCSVNGGLQSLSNPQLDWKVGLYCHMDVHFALCITKSDGYYRFTPVMFESPEVCSEFNIEMEVYGTYSSPEKRLSAKLRCKPCSIDDPKSVLKDLGLSVHHKVMEKMVVPREDNFVFTVAFSFF